MKRLFQHPVIVIIVLITFVNFSLMGCTKNVTKYHPNGTPYNVEEFSSWETLGAIWLGALLLCSLVAISFVHGSVDNTSVTGVFEGESLPECMEGFNKKLFIETPSINNELAKYKPVQLQDMSGNILSEFIVFGDDPRPNDKIIATISREIFIPYAGFLKSDEVTNKIKISLMINSDFTMDSLNPATVTIKNIEFLEDIPCEPYYHTTVVYNGQKIDFFIEAEICTWK